MAITHHACPVRISDCKCSRDLRPNGPSEARKTFIGRIKLRNTYILIKIILKNIIYIQDISYVCKFIVNDNYRMDVLYGPSYCIGWSLDRPPTCSKFKIVCVQLRRSFTNAPDVFTHAARVHCPPNAGGEAPCMWIDCDRVPRKTFALLNHLTDKHCTPHVSILYRLQSLSQKS
jgi:hypothetical protein